ncbi:MAG: aromatic-ring-hydroxylating dioxygenase subunit beta, partial [Dehalococcoidia bacterium]|nr:aromatic-ring-hydroxylating dioxygenase subunit beta [Dehalococcoidia bacterium]
MNQDTEGSKTKLEALLLHHEVEQFLYHEAALLDEWRLDEWLTFFTDDARYVVPTTDLPEGDPR